MASTGGPGCFCTLWPKGPKGGRYDQVSKDQLMPTMAYQQGVRDSREAEIERNMNKHMDMQPPLSLSDNVRNLWKHIRGHPLSFLLTLVPVAILAPHVFSGRDEIVFGLNFLAILPLAAVLGFATEELAMSVGETMGGLLNATFGNAVEMILSVFALKEGLTDVVKGSLLGSILSNLLLVLGMCFFVGGIKNHTQTFNADGARAQSSLLLLAVLALVMPTLAGIGTRKGDADEMDFTELAISRGAAIILGMIYCMYLFFQLGTHPEYFQAGANEEEEEEQMSLSPVFSTGLLLGTTLIVAVCSEGLVGSVEGLTKQMGIKEGFVGVVLLPIVGNAAEHATAVTVAVKNKMDLAMGVALGSSSQIALLVVPFTVLVGWAMDVPMDLNFNPVSTGILMLTVLIVGGLTSDGESNWLEGAMLLAAYLLIAITFWFLE